MTEIERPMTIDEIVKEFDELMITRVGDTPAKRGPDAGRGDLRGQVHPP
jgi:hypothetical protein